MKKQSIWIVCGFDSKSQNWIVIGNLKPMLSPEKFYTTVEGYRNQFSHFGIWVVPNGWGMNSLVAPAENIRSIDQIFLDKDQINTYDDILEDMVFYKNGGGRVVRVLASREGYVMLKEKDKAPELVHWKKLIEEYNLSDKLLK
ncbi:hypothetical protein [Vibrio sp. D431a]|uniref:hypothetical protein n=1 Tax=Vibrio sp. D431a TaxID=2837388 RepID=UPI002554E0CF|nr:hypothetical protein [Vibrio sp. D431a]MDK9790682.1 hypothetical protein [Vibrio sp. D431a]